MQAVGRVLGVTSVAVLFAGMATQAQMIDNTQAPNTAKAGINKSLLDEIGAGRGDVMTAGSSVSIINRDPFRRAPGTAAFPAQAHAAGRHSAANGRMAWRYRDRHRDRRWTVRQLRSVPWRSWGSAGTGGTR